MTADNSMNSSPANCALRRAFLFPAHTEGWRRFTTQPKTNININTTTTTINSNISKGIQVQSVDGRLWMNMQRLC